MTTSQVLSLLLVSAAQQRLPALLAAQLSIANLNALQMQPSTA
jgi:hypothetical protein